MAEKIKFTHEQLTELTQHFKENDFTKTMMIDRGYNLNLEESKVFIKAKEFFGKYWLGNQPSLGIKRTMKNFSKNYPVNFLENADADYIAQSVAEIYTDPEKFNRAIDDMFVIYKEPIEKGLIGYAAQLGKDVDDLTDDEICYVVEKVAEIAGEVGTNVIMQGQQVPELFGVSTKIPQHEDFSAKLSADKINFHKKWTHSDTKLGAPLFFSELSENEATDIEGARNFFGSNPGMEIKYNFLRGEYAKTLDGIDREIYYLSERGYKKKEIAEKLGYSNHSAVSKRMKRMNKDFRQFLGFE